MKTSDLLSRLDRVRSIRGGSAWMASCPNQSGGAHPRGDRNPSLIITEKPDRIKIHCYAGCDAKDIMESLGLHIADIYFVDRHENDPHQRGGRKIRGKYSPDSFDAHAVLESLAIECRIVAMASILIHQHYQNILDKIPEADLKWFDVCLSQETHDRVVLAASRIDSGFRLANGQY